MTASPRPSFPDFDVGWLIDPGADQSLNVIPATETFEQSELPIPPEIGQMEYLCGLSRYMTETPARTPQVPPPDGRLAPLPIGGAMP